jgi:hypothetical protein
MIFQTPPKLPLHEWCVILLFCTILLLLAGFALGREKPIPIPLSSSESTPSVLQVKIEGQVAKPGLYRFPLHTTVRELVEQAEPLPSADLSCVKWRKQLRDGQTVHIPERHWITIHLAGAVQEPGPLKILSGTRCCELADQLDVLPEADLKSLRKKKRFLQEGDLLDVPFLKKKGKKAKAKI